ncbi:hypothetical protein [Streptomyces sp. NPDC047968]|uniref:hypothetical protein n=1 Tax=unclassified Streptomyces TaxID=2593676 RepID=UPI00343B3240
MIVLAAVRVPAFGVVPGHVQVPLTPPVGDRGPVAGLPVGVLGLDQVVPHQIGDQRRVPMGTEPQQHPLLLAAFLGRLTEPIRRTIRARRIILRNGKHFHGTFIVRPKTGQYLDQGPVRR